MGHPQCSGVNLTLRMADLSITETFGEAEVISLARLLPRDLCNNVEI